MSKLKRTKITQDIFLEVLALLDFALYHSIPLSFKILMQILSISEQVLVRISDDGFSPSDLSLYEGQVC